MAVVDSRQHKADDIRAQLEMRLMYKPVLKSSVMNAIGVSFPHTPPPTRDAYIDELNRLQVEIEDAKTALRDIKADIAKAEEEKQKQLIDIDDSIVDNDIFAARQQELKNMLADVEAKSAEICEKARQEAESIKQNAQKEGYEEGLSKGYAESVEGFRQDAEPRLQELSDLIATLTNYGAQLMQEKENEFVELATAIAGKVIGRVIKKDSKFILDMLRDVISKNHRENYINITLSSDMLPLRAKASEEIIALIEEMAQNITVYAEKDIGEEICIVETPKGVTDMSVETQLGNIKETLLEE
jgi:flagellar assembly protein FliH